jgi:hypothetical protein
MEDFGMIAGSSSELQLFHEFIGQRLATGAAGSSVETAVGEFRKYQQELTELRTKLQIAEGQSARGESAPYNAEETKQALRNRLTSRR